MVCMSVYVCTGEMERLSSQWDWIGRSSSDDIEAQSDAAVKVVILDVLR